MKIKNLGIELELEEEISGIELLERLKKEYKKELKESNLDLNTTVVMTVNNELKDLNTKINQDCEIEFFDFNTKEGKTTFWHSTSHLLAQAVKRLYPDALVTIGPAIDDGFYYDFDNLDIKEQDLEEIEQEMKKIAQQKLNFQKKVINKKEAKKLFEKERYKLEILDEINEDTVSIYQDGDFIDLCRGPHIPNTSYIKAIKLTKLAGAYWKGDSKNKMLTRIYGISFPDEKQLKKYLFLIEEAKRRDHRKIGKEMNIFSLHEEGSGFPFLLPNGLIIFNTLIDYWREEHRKAGYVEIKTPIILNKKLWLRSGHWENYKENMYLTKIDNEDYAIKPMNCPGCMIVYKEQVHSYKELPLRIAEIGLVHRHELSGVLSGLFRVRQFHQDDAHIFMKEDQITDEILNVLNLADKIYSLFKLSYHLELSTRPEKSIGTDEQWEKATNGLKNALEKTGKEYKINEGDGAFYGPKIDLHLEDALGRTWQCGTIQLDMSLPERFDLTYMGEDGQNIYRPVMIHRVIYGSLERFIGILIEHFAGKFPLWIAPEQIRVIPVSEKFNDYAIEIKKKFFEKGYRITVDLRDETLSKRIRDAQTMKVNYTIVLGEKEQKNKTINLRDNKRNKILGEITQEEFERIIKQEIEEKLI